MAREIPKAATVHTTVYQNFKGVDYTNDATNVWYRRSPSGVNMISDEAGRPFKRTGWAEVVGKDDFELAFGSTLSEDFEINMCYYFTLAGDFHIIVFTTDGVFKYVNNVLELMESDPDGQTHDYDTIFIESYERAFFFEGGGTSAFYVYGSPKIVWKYGYDNGEYTWGLVNPTEPTVIVGATPDGTGTLLQNYNLLGSISIIQYITNDVNGDGTLLKVTLPNNVPQSAITDGDIEVWGTTTIPFDTPLDVIAVPDPSNPPTLATGECALWTDTAVDNPQAWITFYDVFDGTNDGIDVIKVRFPSTNVIFTDHVHDGLSGNADTYAGSTIIELDED